MAREIPHGIGSLGVTLRHLRDLDICRSGVYYILSDRENEHRGLLPEQDLLLRRAEPPPLRHLRVLERLVRVQLRRRLQVQHVSLVRVVAESFRFHVFRSGVRIFHRDSLLKIIMKKCHSVILPP